MGVFPIEAALPSALAAWDLWAGEIRGCWSQAGSFTYCRHTHKYPRSNKLELQNFKMKAAYL